MRGYTVPTAFLAIDRYSAPVRKMAGATAAFVNSSRVGLAHTERAFRRLMSPLTAINRLLMGMGYYVGLFTFIALMRGALSIIGDFQQAQIDISVVNGKSVQDNKHLATQARELALRYGEEAKAVSALQLSLIKMGYASDKVQMMTQPVMAASVALKGDPEEVAKRIGAILGAFKIDPNQTSTVADLLAKSADLSALDWSDLATMLPTAMQSANIAFKDKAPIDRLKELLAMFAMVRNAQVHVASGSTGIKNMLIDAGIRGKTYQEMLQRIVESPNQLKSAYKLFGRKTIVSALPLADAQSLGSIEDFIQKMSDSGYATRVAEDRMKSINGRIKLLKTSYQELILSIDDGTGPLAKSVESYLKVGSAVLLLSANSEESKKALSQMDTATIKTAESVLWWLKVLKWVTVLLIASRVLMLLWSTAVGIATAVAWLWNAAQGMMAFFLGWNTRLIVGNIVAMNAYRFAAGLAAVATRAFSAVMATTPLGWAIIGLGALGYMLTKTSDKYDAVAKSATKASDAMKLSDQQKAFYSGSGTLSEKFYPFGNTKIGNLPITPMQQPQRREYLDEKLVNWIINDLKKIPKALGIGSMDSELQNPETGSLGQQPQALDSLQSMMMKMWSEFQGGNLKLDIAGMPAGSQLTGDKKFIGNIQPSLDSTFMKR